MRAWVILLTVMQLMPVGVSRAQYLFLDQDGDGLRTGADQTAANTTADLGVYLITDKGRDGSMSSLSGEGSPELTINSYEIIFRAVGGTVEWIGFRNEMETMTTPFRERKGGSDYYIGFGGGQILPPGKYRLGTLSVRAVSGTPRIEFGARSPLRATLLTSFGSKVVGRDGDNTLKFRTESENYGDWGDADGMSLGAAEARAGAVDVAVLQFATWIGRTPSPTGTLFVRTTTPGPIRAMLFNSQGRLVRKLADGRSVPAGEHSFVLSQDRQSSHWLPAGVYFYKVQAGENHATGKVVIVR